MELKKAQKFVLTLNQHFPRRTSSDLKQPIKFVLLILKQIHCAKKAAKYFFDCFTFPTFKIIYLTGIRSLKNEKNQMGYL